MPRATRKLASYLFAGMLLITTASLPVVANAEPMKRSMSTHPVVVR